MQNRLLTYYALKCTGVGLQGAGTAAVFSTTFLWLETLMPVTNGIGAAYTVAWNVAVQVLSIVIVTVTLQIEESYILFIFSGLFTAYWTIYCQ